MFKEKSENQELSKVTCEKLLKKYPPDKIKEHIARLNLKTATNPVGLLIKSLSTGYTLNPTAKETETKDRKVQKELEKKDQKQRKEELEEMKKQKETRDEMELIYATLGVEEKRKLQKQAAEEITAESQATTKGKGLEFLLNNSVILKTKILQIMNRKKK